MNSGRELVGGGTDATRTGEPTASAIGVKQPAAATRSDGTMTVGTVVVGGAAPTAAGQPGQCFPGPNGPSAGGSSSRPGSVGVARERHESHEQSGRGFATCDAACWRPEGTDWGGSDGVRIGTNRQMHMPGGMSSDGSIRSRTNARSIAYSSNPNPPDAGIIPFERFGSNPTG